MSTPQDSECPLTELPASQCACPKHRGGGLPAEEIETVGQPFEAMFDGWCRRCERTIHPGDQIARTAEGSPGGRDATYVHARRCPR